MKVDLSLIHLIHLQMSRKQNKTEKPTFRIFLITDPASHGPGPEMLTVVKGYLYCMTGCTATGHVQFNINRLPEPVLAKPDLNIYK